MVARLAEIARKSELTILFVTTAYAEITNHKVSKDLAVLSENIKGKYALPNDGMPSRVFKCGNYSGWKKECESSDKIKIK